jgi:protein TonB
MDKNNFYFYISGFISLLLFIFFSTLFVISIILSKKNDSFAIKKDNYISVSIDMPKIETSSIKKNVESLKEIDKKIVVKDEAPKESTKVEEKKVRNVEDLFSQVWTKDIKKTQEIKKPTNDKRVLDEIQKKIKKSDSNRAESISQKIMSMDTTKRENENSKASTATEVNEYLAKIQALVYQYFKPPENSQGNSVTAVIELSSMGKVIDFRILTYSDNEALNRECDNIKERLLNVLFPENPSGRSSLHKVKLISKE